LRRLVGSEMGRRDSDISFELRHGEKAAVVGVNGAGKSTLLLHTDGLLLPTSGRIVVGDVPITKRTLPVIRRTVGYVFQQPDDQLFMPTVGEDVAFGPANMGLDEAEIDRRVVEALTAVGAESLRDRSPAHLSGGQKKRVAIATVLAMGPSVLVMDEPTAALDPQAQRQLIDLIRGFSHTTLIATHDMALVRELCTRVLVLHQGMLAADGPADEILSNHALLAACGLE
ncbi:MAG: energy-coupling factor ABC transporter ATP-binding protein, partial [Alistipes sp.]|nr:energy-coupling factor ABC transporter ATP-binding protein [Alistipes sp.]